MNNMKSISFLKKRLSPLKKEKEQLELDLD